MINKTPAIIIQQDKQVKSRTLFLPIAALAIYSVFLPVLLLDIWLSLYQAVYFSITDIPKVRKKDFISFDRWDLSKLNIWQKINCVYCEYVNGTLAWARAVANQTEIHSCAIKYSHAKKGAEHQSGYYEYEIFK